MCYTNVTATQRGVTAQLYIVMIDALHVNNTLEFTPEGMPRYPRYGNANAEYGEKPNQQQRSIQNPEHHLQGCWRSPHRRNPL
jgi:hypothetical protein